MKNFLFCLAGAAILLSACKKDECVPGSLETNIVGEWRVTVLGISAGDVEFRANGTLVDEDDALVGGEVGGVVLDEKSYNVESNSRFTVRASKGTNFIEYDVDVNDYTCDEIDIEVAGVIATMKRKD